MGVDINLFRPERGGDPDVVRKSELRRCRSGSVVDKVIESDSAWRRLNFEMESLKKELNLKNKEIGLRKKTNADDSCESLIEQTQQIKADLANLERKTQEAVSQRDHLLNVVGNIVHESVRGSANEEENEVLRKWGVIDRKVMDGTPGRLAHYEIIQKLNGVDTKRGTEVAGHRGYYLKGYGVMLNQALVQYGLSFLRRRGYTEIQPPFFLRKEIMSAAAELKDFEESLYRIPMGGNDENAVPPSNTAAPETSTSQSNDSHDMFLIATSEQPICALHKGDYLEPKDLPIKYAGISTCFRKEAGSHGKDMRGIFRIHQFEKVEQFAICLPEESWAFQEEMIRTSEEFYQSLDIPYRIVSIVGGALNDAAARKYDLEAWFPSHADYRELVSCSNCLDYQSRSLGVRLGTPKVQDREKNFVHMLNGTLTATQRTMCCILEHYQTPTGVNVPRVLQPYMDGMSFLPFKS